MFSLKTRRILKGGDGIEKTQMAVGASNHGVLSAGRRRLRCGFLPIPRCGTPESRTGPRPVEEIYYDEKHEVLFRLLYEYDAQGYPVKKTCIDEDITTVTLYEYQYDAFGLLTQKLECNASEQEPYSVTNYTYDIAGNLRAAKETYPKNPALLSGTRYRYDLAGNRIWERRSSQNYDNCYTQEYQYDAEGRCTQELTTRFDGTLYDWVEYQYE